MNIVRGQPRTIFILITTCRLQIIYVLCMLMVLRGSIVNHSSKQHDMCKPRQFIVNEIKYKTCMIVHSVLRRPVN
jgi:hypothetical protein